jgi:hypothetical protein
MATHLLIQQIMMIETSEYHKIVNLINSFFHYIDDPEDTPTGFLNLWAKNAKFSFPYRNLDTTDLAAVLESMKTKFVNHHHIESNIVFDRIDSVTMKSKSYWSAMNEGETVAIGRHQDTFTCVEGEWKFSERVVILKWSKSDGNIMG